MYRNFTKMYPVSKTLRFELKPIGSTLQNLKTNEILKDDEKRAEAYSKVKKLIDEYHKAFIEKVLSEFKFDNEKLKLYYEHSMDVDNAKIKMVLPQFI